MPKLYVVGTPIGNLKDISQRALEALGSVDLILCEDTRVTKKLLAHYGIEKPMKRMDAHIEASSAGKVTDLFESYERIALVSDAGTPTLSDPGDRLVRAARSAGVAIEVVPGPAALTAALSVSGLPASEFTFLGFVPHKKGREKLFAEVAESTRTIVMYESPHRIMKTLSSLVTHLSSERTVVVARELTKLYESTISGTPQEVFDHFTAYEEEQRGEFVVIVSGV
ncbi:MAG: 16S rRNA (cytidine(1402)-2'-O)-methyltransferase [Candidatus Pacebacteria bacterium]|nr:16S rRNA (cytidine(1402)-2'-O)-methyltransferase [Candidatus Paceibacterota bacterium]